MRPVRIRKKALDGSGAFWAEAVVDRRSRGLAVTRDRWASDASRWSVTHIASGWCVTQGLTIEAARWLLSELLRRRVAWTKPKAALMASLSERERATLRLLVMTAMLEPKAERRRAA